MSKLCLSCMRKIPLFAGRCPYCRDDNQGVHGRFILLLLFLVVVFISIKVFLKVEDNSIVEYQEQEVKEQIDIDSELLQEFNKLNI